MKTAKGFSIVTGLCLAVACGLALVGCETNEDVAGQENVPVFRIVPARTTYNHWAYAEQAPIVLEVEGGSGPFKWSASNTGLGTVSSATEPYVRRVFYQPKANQKGLNVVEVSDNNRWIAHADILQDTVSITLQGAPASSPNVLTITGTNQVVTVTVAGGLAPFSWSVERPDVGDVDRSLPRTTQYQRNETQVGVNTLYATDQQGFTVTATIAQYNP